MLKTLQMSLNKAPLHYSPRFEGSVGRFLDLLSYILTYPWIVSFSLTVSSFIPLKPDTRSFSRRAWDLAIQGPLLILLTLTLMPLATSGFFIWIVICTLCKSKPYSSVEIHGKHDSKNVSGDGAEVTKFSFATMNVLLGQEAIGKFNNCSLVYRRIKRIAEEIRFQDKEHLNNLEKTLDISKNESVLLNFPRMDFLCFQEVFDRVHALALISLLRRHYSYFIYDISDNSFRTNHFLLNSGLLIASKYPVLKTHFHPFTWKTSLWQQCIAYGVVVCKLDLGHNR